MRSWIGKCPMSITISSVFADTIELSVMDRWNYFEAMAEGLAAAAPIPIDCHRRNKLRTRFEWQSSEPVHFAAVPSLESGWCERPLRAMATTFPKRFFGPAGSGAAMESPRVTNLRPSRSIE